MAIDYVAFEQSIPQSFEELNELLPVAADFANNLIDLLLYETIPRNTIEF
uniref:Uncharacterized protein n=1 Tax=Tetranychus urticae TaxID=32264 RepID=T1KIW2_TETUR